MDGLTALRVVYAARRDRAWLQARARARQGHRLMFTSKRDSMSPAEMREYEQQVRRQVNVNQRGVRGPGGHRVRMPGPGGLRLKAGVGGALGAGLLGLSALGAGYQAVQNRRSRKPGVMASRLATHRHRQRRQGQTQDGPEDRLGRAMGRATFSSNPRKVRRSARRAGRILGRNPDLPGRLPLAREVEMRGPTGIVKMLGGGLTPERARQVLSKRKAS